MSLYGLDHLISQAIMAGIDGAVQHRSAHFNAGIGEEVVELRPVNFVAWMGGVLLALGVTYAIAAYLEPDVMIRCIVLVFTVLFLAAGVWLIRFRTRHRVYFNTHTLYLRPVFGELLMHPFSDIRSVGKTRNGKDLLLELHSGKKVTISHYLIGMPTLAFALMNRDTGVN